MHGGGGRASLGRLPDPVPDPFLSSRPPLFYHPHRHQKLHNNTTPDDVPICQAYLAFLESNGDEGRYWRVLSDNGVTRQRLESFDRPIKTAPQFFPDKKV